MVNSLYDLFDAPGTKPEAEQLIVNGRYMLPPIGDPTGKRRSLQRVTNFIKQISDTAGLEGWKLRSALQGLASREDLYDLASSLDFAEKQEWNKLVERCIDAAKAWQGSGGNETGTALHNYTDNVGKTPMRVRPKWIPKVENYQRALHEQGLRVVPGLSERLVVSEKFGTCGRLDDVYEDIYGIRYVGDRKSQKEFYTWFEIGAQLALYRDSDVMWNEAECRFEDMPTLSVDYGIVAWMPLVHPGPDPTAVELYHVPLEGPRELLGIMATVRTLRTQARRWASPMPELTAFERIARDIRDANSTQDLVKIRDFNLPNWSENLHLMAAKRWDELATPILPPVELAGRIAALEDAAIIGGSTVPHSPIQVAKNQAQWTEERMTSPVLDWSKIGAGLPRPHLGQDISPNGEMRFSSEMLHNFGNDTTKVTITGPSDAEAWERLAAMFEAPAQEATFPATSEQRVTDDVSFEEFQQRVASSTVEIDVLRKPMEWAAHLGLELTIQADSDGVWCKPMPLKTFRSLYATEVALAQVAADVAKLQAQPVITAPYDQGQHRGAVVVELPDDEAISLAREERPISTTEALGTVPIKVVREVCGRAHNSKSSRGRVRLLNDVETAKYAKHAAALMPALLREWLVIDGGPSDGSEGPADCIRSTEGSKRPAMSSDLAGAVSLSQFLKSQGEDVPERAAKKGGAAPAQGGTDAFGQPVADVSSLPEAPAEEPGLQPYADAPAEQQGIRRQYGDITPDKHSVLRLVEMAKGAANGAERGLVFRELARRRAMTGAIAAEINQHYLDNGYTVENFDPYFEQQEAGHLADVVAPLVNNLPGCRREYDILREATLAELIMNALNVETPSERGKVIFEIARRDAWGRVSLQELDAAWKGEGLPGIPEIISDPNANYLRFVLPRIQACRTVSDLHELWADLMPLPCFHSEQAQEALQVQLRSVSP